MLLLPDVRDDADCRSRRGCPRFAFFGFLTALLVGCVLACGDFVEGAPIRFHPNLGAMRRHGARDVPGDAHDHLGACVQLGEFRDQRVAVMWQLAR